MMNEIKCVEPKRHATLRKEETQMFNCLNRDGFICVGRFDGYICFLTSRHDVAPALETNKRTYFTYVC